MKGVKIVMNHNTHIIYPKNSDTLKKEMQAIGADELGIRMMLPKGEFMIIKLQRVSLKAANIIKQEMLSKGGEAVLHKNVSMLTQEISDILLMGTEKHYKELIKKFRMQPFGLKQIAKEIEEVLESSRQRNKGIEIGNLFKVENKTLVMGILNVTPDSFSDGGKYNNISLAIEKALKLVDEGADIIDIGGESTRPDHRPVSLDEELKRVIPIVERLAKEITVPISIDTYKAEVARQAINAGAKIINDVWGFKKDPNIAKVAAELNVPIILMHNREEANYSSLMDDIIEDLRESIKIALDAGVEPTNIILDPGIGFAKTYEDNLIVMNNLEDIVSLGYPVLLGTSRKSLIGKTLDLPVEERIEGTAATVALGITKGCRIIRVHDVKEMKRVAKMMDAMIYKGQR